MERCKLNEKENGGPRHCWREFQQTLHCTYQRQPWKWNCDWKLGFKFFLIFFLNLGARKYKYSIKKKSSSSNLTDSIICN